MNRKKRNNKRYRTKWVISGSVFMYRFSILRRHYKKGSSLCRLEEKLISKLANQIRKEVDEYILKIVIEKRLIPPPITYQNELVLD